MREHLLRPRMPRTGGRCVALPAGALLPATVQPATAADRPA
ncbi:hypothetical protein [Streptomyces sp. NBC_00236]|nr:hypothetical protein [Streptomyces sp. NBC_00236]